MSLPIGNRAPTPALQKLGAGLRQSSAPGGQTPKPPAGPAGPNGKPPKVDPPKGQELQRYIKSAMDDIKAQAERDNPNGGVPPMTKPPESSGPPPPTDTGPGDVQGPKSGGGPQQIMKDLQGILKKLSDQLGGPGDTGGPDKTGGPANTPTRPQIQQPLA